MRSIATLLLAAASLAVILAVTAPGDYGRYGSTFDWEGLPGFVRMRSVIAVQIWAVAASAVLLPLGLREAGRHKATVARRALGIASGCAIAGWVGYLLAVGGIAYVSRAGMFGMGPAGFLVIFVLFPSVLLLIAAIIATLVGYGVLAVRG